MKVELLTAPDGSFGGITIGPSRLTVSRAVCSAAHLLYELAGELREQELDRVEALAAALAAAPATPDRPVDEDAVEDSPPLDGPDLGDRAQPAGGGVEMTAPDVHVDERTRAAADELLEAGVGPALVATELGLPLPLVRLWKQEMRPR